MATRAQLRAAINAVLNHPLGVSRYQLVGRATRAKAYEAYVFSLCIRAVADIGGHPVLKGSRGIIPPKELFVFRGGPGKIHSTERNYIYAEFRLGESAFEIHAGIQVTGNSGMTHELDVCILHAAEAEAARRGPTYREPRAAGVVGSWEGKFYADDLPKHQGRAYVGLLDDFGWSVRIRGLCTNSDSAELRKFLKPKRRPDPRFRLSPLRPAEETCFISALQDVLKKLTGM